MCSYKHTHNSAVHTVGAIASVSNGMAVDKDGNVAFFITYGGLASDSKGPSFSGLATINGGVAVNTMPGIEKVTDLIGSGGTFSASGGVPLANAQLDFISDAYDNIVGVGVGGTAGPDFSIISYQNTTTHVIAMTGDNFKKMEATLSSAFSNASKLAKQWTKASTENGAVGVWEAGPSELSYEEVSGKKGMYQAVINTTMMFKAAGKGENNSTNTTTRIETGVFFEKDKDGNMVSTDIDP